MDSLEFSEWLAYDQLDLIPDPWRMVGILCQTIAASQGVKSEVDDFIPIPKPPRIISGEAGRSMFRGMLTRAREFEKNQAKLTGGVGVPAPAASSPARRIKKS